MNSGHADILHEGEFLHSQSLVQVLLLDILANLFIWNGLSLNISGRKGHPRAVVVFVINHIHIVIPDIRFFDFLLFLGLVFFQYGDVLAIWALDNLFLLLLELPDSSLTHGPFVDEELFVGIKVGVGVFGVEGWRPLPTRTHETQMVASKLELVCWELAGLYETVFIFPEPPVESFVHSKIIKYLLIIIKINLYSSNKYCEWIINSFIVFFRNQILFTHIFLMFSSIFPRITYFSLSSISLWTILSTPPILSTYSLCCP